MSSPSDGPLPPNLTSASAQPSDVSQPSEEHYRVLTEADLGDPIERLERRRLVPLLLFLATCFFTFAAGTYGWIPTLFGMQGDAWDLPGTLQMMIARWDTGLIYMACVMGMLTAHEMGHFLMTVRYRIPASFPIFLPMPMMYSGTMGAVIGMEGSRANRKQLFDIGLAGPLAGLVVTIPLVWIGIKIADVAEPGKHGLAFGDPLLAQLLIKWLRPEIPEGGSIFTNPIYMAGWIGMFITGLNMLPLSQLDGGHVVYALFRKKSYVIARGFLLIAIGYVIISGNITWTLMIVIIAMIGVDHPPTSDDDVDLGPVRTVLGTLSLGIPILCFTPVPIYMT
jgi:Zn-dependent protease